MSDIKELATSWIAAKAEEKAAIETRRAIEDAIASLLRIDAEKEGTTRAVADAFEIKIATRIDRKVDADLVQEIAAEHGLSEHLSTLFRWKPEINMTLWKQADDSITRPLARAITAKAGRPSITITHTTSEEQHHG